jgi:hypothetical protein
MRLILATKIQYDLNIKRTNQHQEPYDNKCQLKRWIGIINL